MLQQCNTALVLAVLLHCRRYGLNVHYLKNPDFKAGLEEYLAEAGTAAIVLGTRRCTVLPFTSSSHQQQQQQQHTTARMTRQSMTVCQNPVLRHCVYIAHPLSLQLLCCGVLVSVYSSARALVARSILSCRSKLAQVVGPRVITPVPALPC